MGKVCVPHTKPADPTRRREIHEGQHVFVRGFSRGWWVKWVTVRDGVQRCKVQSWNQSLMARETNTGELVPDGAPVNEH